MRIGTPAALTVLMDRSLHDGDPEVRHSCIDHLEQAKNPQTVGGYIRYLSSKDNRTINRAAVALGRLQDLAAIPALIESLVTIHKYKVVTGADTNATFSRNGNSGLSFGGGGPKIVRESRQNPDVLRALVALAGEGVNHEYDKRHWKRWYAGQRKRPPRVNTRRD